jgi:hypothetical protein
MGRRPIAIFGAAVLAAVLGGASCTTRNDDPIGRACSVIVRDCHAMQDMGDCIDVVGELDQDCALCIGDDNDCSYFTECQRSFVQCNLPSELEPPGSGSGDP